MYTIVKGDLAPDMLITVSSSAEPGGSNITGALAIELDWLKPDGTRSSIALATVDLSTGQVRRQWQTGDTDVPGTHQGRVVVTRGDGRQQTFPSDGSALRWVVQDELRAC